MTFFNLALLQIPVLPLSLPKELGPWEITKTRYKPPSRLRDARLLAVRSKWGAGLSIRALACLVWAWVRPLYRNLDPSARNLLLGMVSVDVSLGVGKNHNDHILHIYPTLMRWWDQRQKSRLLNVSKFSKFPYSYWERFQSSNYFNSMSFLKAMYNFLVAYNNNNNIILQK